MLNFFYLTKSKNCDIIIKLSDESPQPTNQKKDLEKFKKRLDK